MREWGDANKVVKRRLVQLVDRLDLKRQLVRPVSAALQPVSDESQERGGDRVVRVVSFPSVFVSTRYD